MKITITLAGIALATFSNAATLYDWNASSGLFPDQVSAVGGTSTLINTSSETPSLSATELTLPSSATQGTALYYTLNFGSISPTNDIFSQGIAITTTFIVDSSSAFDNRRGAVALGFRTGESRQSTATGIDYFRLIRDFETGSPIASVDTNESFHTYRIEIEGTAAGSPIRVFQDGTQILSRTMGALDSGESNEISIDFGESSAIARGTSRFQSFKVETIPEPTSVTLLVLGSSFLITRRRRK